MQIDPACVRALILSCIFCGLPSDVLGETYLFDNLVTHVGRHENFTAPARVRSRLQPLSRICRGGTHEDGPCLRTSLRYGCANALQTECFAYRCNIRGFSIPLKKTCVSLLGASLMVTAFFVFFSVFGDR